jgi:hypothetical protein
MGKILKELAEIVIADPSKNDRETLLNIVRARVGADVPTGESSSADKKS